jgi:hypothetical protein
MARSSSVHALPGQLEYLLPGRNALETSVALGQAWTRKGKPYMLVETVKRVLETLDRNQIPYAVIGGLAVSHHSKPRLTQDVDLVVLQEDTGRVRALFPGCYQRGTAIVEVYDIDGTRVDFLPAKLRYQREVVRNSGTGEIEGTPARVASVRDLLLLKMFAAPNRHELDARIQDQADIASLLRINASTITAQDIRYIGDRMLELCFTAEDRAQTVAQLRWLNDALAQLHLSDRAYPLPAGGNPAQGNPSPP